MSGFGESLPRPASQPVEEPTAEDILRALTSNTPYGIFRSNAAGGCEFVNDRWCELTGLRREQAMGDGWAQSIHPEDRDRVAAEWAEASRRGRDSIVEYRFVRSDGSICWIEGFATPLRDARGTVVGWIGTCLDLTARKATEAALLSASEHDALTGLGNRRKLTADLDRALSRTAGHAPHLLVLFDLNGFKNYNDCFGHPAGDALLARLAGQLAAAARGAAYRMGGDEFCVLADIEAVDPCDVLDATVRALSDSGDGFAVSSSSGAVFLPAEAADADSALKLADERLYAHKHEVQAARDEPSQVLLRVLLERDPSLRHEGGAVANLAARVGAQLGLNVAALTELRLAAELHDVGKLAVPDSVLKKPGPLNEEEWSHIRRHPLVGQSILAASPALHNVGEIVRSTHEHWDGHGYIDALTGHEIPLAARIITVCDAYTAMVSERPYRAPLSHDQALAELRRCAFTQFDPEIVRVVCAELERDRSAAGRLGRPATGPGPNAARAAS
jgi:diguanylate cyclase (GGDEF)-like protein/PAS domain S-box-containing protein